MTTFQRRKRQDETIARCTMVLVKGVILEGHHVPALADGRQTVRPDWLQIRSIYGAVLERCHPLRKSPGFREVPVLEVPVLERCHPLRKSPGFNALRDF